MTDVNDTARLAQEFLKLWQREITRQMSDPATMSAMLQAMQAFYQPGGTDGGKNAYDAARRTADTPDAEHDAVRELSKRIRELEQQLAKLHGNESVLAKAKKPARARKRSHVRSVAEPERPAKPGRKRVAKRAAGRRHKKPGKGKAKR